MRDRESKQELDTTEELLAGADTQCVDTQSADTVSTTTDPSEPSKSRSMMFPTWGDLLAILGLFMVVQLTTLFIFSLLGFSTLAPEGFESMDYAAHRAAEFSMGKMIFYWSIISQPMMLLMVIIYGCARSGKFGSIHLSMRGFDPTILLWGILLILSLEVVIEPLMQLLPQQSTPNGRGIYMLLSLVVVAPIFEELLCRGVILEAIRKKRGALAGCVISALIFGIMHFEPQSALNAFIVGILLGYLYLRTNSIFAPILLHAVNNALAYFLLIFGLAETSISELINNEYIYSIIYIVAAVILVVSLFGISRYISRLNRGDRHPA
ncbi:MAG: CPBP family intramembrane glutamic endopeptidase [Rikenellaceae bacterium]